ncbi:hypothetical protein [Streptomyces sp900116325]|uniref:hypothetical protein n=1 Tax=Streptomyces sp. 900116325 TaxID=3154295 RepID=UPI0033B1E0E4
MKIRMLVEMTGSRDGEPWPAKGKTVDLPTAAAAHLVSAGIAEAADEDKPPRKGGRRAAVSNP